jgi:L-iditol 2-dehydrogenase
VNTIPAVMQVARLYSWGDVRVEQEAVPRPGPGEALIRIEACGVCGSDALQWYVNRKAPVVLGHEPAGTVVATGHGVQNLEEGDRVFVHHHAPCHQCAECRRGLWSNCEVWKQNGLAPGGFAQFARVAAGNVLHDSLHLPAEMSFEAATFIEPVACCIRAVRARGQLQPGDDVCIIGLGAMGLVMVQLARVYGAGRILGSDFLADRRARAHAAGACVVIDPATTDGLTAVRDATGGRGADLVLVCPGDPRAIRAGLEAAAPGGRVVCFTPLAPDVPLEIDQSGLYFREITLTQSYSCGPDETREALRLLADHKLDVLPLITHREALTGVAAALNRAAGKGGGIKSVILPWA